MNPPRGGWVILLSISAAMVLSIAHLPLSWPDWLSLLRPNWLVVVLFFWVVELPHRVGLIGTWTLGLLVDVLLAEPLGLNGLILAGVTYVSWRFYERLRMYSALQQSGVVFVLVGLAEVIRALVLNLDSERGIGLELVTVPFISMLAWPVVYLALLRLRVGLRIE